jgi:hypothetical protein
MKRVLLIVPSRKRQEKVVEFYKYFKENSTITDLCIGLDDDDFQNYPIFDDVIYDINPNMKLGPKLNCISKKYLDHYDYIAFMGDDHWIKTFGWDQKLVDSLENIPNGIAYGNDLFQGENLPTAVLMDSNIIFQMGYMCPPSIKHLYLDNFWLDLGKSLGTLRYCPDVIIEHMHFTNGKSNVDDIYAEVNSAEMYDHDKREYDNYIQNNFQNDLKKIGLN